eukprot:2469088-Rhodomonas_salina.2
MSWTSFCTGMPRASAIVWKVWSYPPSSTAKQSETGDPPYLLSPVAGSRCPPSALIQTVRYSASASSIMSARSCADRLLPSRPIAEVVKGGCERSCVTVPFARASSAGSPTAARPAAMKYESQPYSSLNRPPGTRKGVSGCSTRMPGLYETYLAKERSAKD